MKINNIFKSFAIGAILAPLAVGCDSVDENDRYIEMPPVESNRVVLLEDFTGQYCVNCPDAHEVMEQLSEQYAGSLIPVSIHAKVGNLAIMEGEFGPYEGTDGMIGLTNEQGSELAKRAGITSKLPAGSIDGGSLCEYPYWAAEVRNAMQVPTSIEMEGSATVDAEGKITASATMVAGQQIDHALTISMWVLESGIVAIQQTSSGLTMSYVHNNVFRGAIGELFGNPLTLDREEPKTVEYSTPAKEHWNLANLSVVAFVSDNSGKVMQATIFPVTPAE